MSGVQQSGQAALSQRLVDFVEGCTGTYRGESSVSGNVVAAMAAVDPASNTEVYGRYENATNILR